MWPAAMLNLLSSDFKSMAIFVTLIFIFLYIPYLYLFKFNFWRKKGVRGSIPVPFFGNVLNKMGKPSCEIQLDTKRRFGEIIGLYEGHRPTLYVTDLQVIKNILVRDFHIFTNSRSVDVDENSIIAGFMSVQRDSEWKRIRNCMTPNFTTSKMKSMFKVMTDCVNDILIMMREDIKIKDGDNKSTKIDVKKLVASYSLDVISRCCFITKTNTYRDSNDPFLIMIGKMFDINVLKMILFQLLPFKWTVWLGVSVTPKEPDEFFTQLTDKLIAERIKSGIRQNDFLQSLIDARVDGADSETPSKPQKGQLSKNEIIANLMIFFAAGYETTASFINYSFYELASNQDVQDKLFQELQECQEVNFSYESVCNNIYLDAFVHEVLRKYPPITILDRESSDIYEIVCSDGHRFTIPGKTLVYVPVYAVHHDPENFPNPGKFDPGRFLPENKSQIKPYSWLPFAAGNRNCIAFRFALLEGKILIAKLISNFEVKKCDDTKIVFTKGSDFLTCKPISLDFQER